MSFVNCNEFKNIIVYITEYGIVACDSRYTICTDLAVNDDALYGKETGQLYELDRQHTPISGTFSQWTENRMTLSLSARVMKTKKTFPGSQFCSYSLLKN